MFVSVIYLFRWFLSSLLMYFNFKSWYWSCCGRWELLSCELSTSGAETSSNTWSFSLLHDWFLLSTDQRVRRRNVLCFYASMLCSLVRYLSGLLWILVSFFYEFFECFKNFLHEKKRATVDENINTLDVSHKDWRVKHSSVFIARSGKREDWWRRRLL